MTARYIPILSIRPAEIVALSELPDVAKDRMTPLFLVKPWLGAGSLMRGIEKVIHSYPGRRWFAELDPQYDPGSGSEAFGEISSLRDPAAGFQNWVHFVGTLPNAVPVLQLRGSIDAPNVLDQIDRAAALGRGVAVRIDRAILSATASINPLIDLFAQRAESDFTVIVDYGQRDYRILVDVIPAVADMNYIRNRMGAVELCMSSTTFPSSFSSSSQEIYERSFFSEVNSQVGGLIYSDRGSARAAEQSGGGVPRPRIDLPTASQWHFFRSDCVKEEGELPEDFRDRRIEAYGEMADAAVNSPFWDPALNIWGTQLIKITQLRSQYGITSPAKATACRINIHLTKQSLYGVSISENDLEEEWVD